jgi:hypothetical protein
MLEWISTHLIEALVFGGMILHTAMKVGEWIKSRESAPSISEADLLKALNNEREKTRRDIEDALEGCVTVDIHRALHDAMDRRVDTLERVTFHDNRRP